MGDLLLTGLNRLRAELERLAARERELEQRNRELVADNERFQLQAQEAKKALERAELDVHYLTVSHRLADNPDSLAETRREVAKLIRNIDRCLEML